MCPSPAPAVCFYVCVRGGFPTALVDFNWPVLNVLPNCSSDPLDGIVSESVIRYRRIFDSVIPC